MAKPPSSPIRLTITVTPEVHATFSRMAEVSGMSLGRCMGEWLADTSEGAEFLTATLERAREAPRTVIREMRQGVLGLGDELDQLMTDLRSGKIVLPAQAGGRGAARAARGGPPAPSPRSVIRGGKSRPDRAKASGNEPEGSKS